jgi:hypothetical protein
MEMDLWYDLYVRELVAPTDVAAEYVRRGRVARTTVPASDDDGAPAPASSWRRTLRHALCAAA